MRLRRGSTALAAGSTAGSGRQEWYLVGEAPLGLNTLNFMSYNLT